tara:strand:- start:3298 stop:4773 length:1476 start_codon:yes stop_codon:yes gene_type:complete
MEFQSDNYIDCNGQLYEELVNLSKYYETTRKPLFGKKPKYIETFLDKIGAKGGNTTNVTDTTTIKKKADLSTDINRDMVVNAVNKIVNEVSNEVAQANKADMSLGVGCSNSTVIMGVTCDVMNVTTKQESKCRSVSNADLTQKNTSSIKSDFSTNLQTKVTNSLPNDTAKIQEQNNQAMLAFAKSMPDGYDPDKASKLVGGMDTGGFNNTNNINTSYNLDQELKQTFNLSEKFEVNNKNEVSNTIDNKVSNENYSSCASSTLSNNNLFIADVVCKRLNVDAVQSSMAEALLDCMINQESISEISNSIVNTIEDNFSRMYDDISNKPTNANYTPQDKYDDLYRLDAYGQAVGESFLNAAGRSEPSSSSTKESNSGSNDTNGGNSGSNNSSGGNSGSNNSSGGDSGSDKFWDKGNNSSGGNTGSNNDEPESTGNGNSSESKAEEKKEEEEENFIDSILISLGIPVSESNRILLITISVILILFIIYLMFTLVK